MMKMQEEISCEIQPIKTPLLYWFKAQFYKQLVYKPHFGT